MPTHRDRLRRLIEKLCIIEGDFVLSTGGKSRYYFDCKIVTLDGEGLTLIGEEFLREIEKLPVQPTAIGGLTMGADFITAAVILLSHQTGGKVLQGSIARKEPKQHGTRRKIENELPAGTRIVVIDDVITTGSSTLKACQEFEQAGYEIVGILGVVDREAGGREALEKKYKYVRTLFKTSDFPELASQLAQNGTRRAVA
jgi:orotate phosphoribosyltransferase